MLRALFPITALTVLLTAVPVPALAQAKAAAVPKAASSAVVNINTATAAELDSLPGIGAKTAARIVEYRQKNGPFKKVEELMNVRGVGEKNFLKLKPQITVTAAKPEQRTANQ